MPEDELRELCENLAANQSKRPFVKVPLKNVIWVKPKSLCRVSYTKKGKKGGLFEAQIEHMLSEVDLSNR